MDHVLAVLMSVSVLMTLYLLYVCRVEFYRIGERQTNALLHVSRMNSSMHESIVAALEQSCGPQPSIGDMVVETESTEELEVGSSIEEVGEEAAPVGDASAVEAPIEVVEDAAEDAAAVEAPIEVVEDAAPIKAAEDAAAGVVEIVGAAGVVEIVGDSSGDAVRRRRRPKAPPEDAK